jgi:hypothetical protein
MLGQLSQTLQQLSNEERKAIFFKLEHDAPVSLSGTGLKAISQPTSNVTLAVPRRDNLDQFVAKINDFGTGPVTSGHAPNESLAYLTNVQPGDPKDRLSDEMFAQYPTLIQQKSVICEIEILSLKVGHRNPVLPGRDKRRSSSLFRSADSRLSARIRRQQATHRDRRAYAGSPTLGSRKVSRYRPQMANVPRRC